MDKYKSRGKRIDNDEWVYGSLIVDEITDKHYIVLSIEESEKVGEEGCLNVISCEVIPETLGGYIGLNDKNNKEIYKVDIIKAINRNYDCEENREEYFQLFEVTYLNGCYMFGNWSTHEFFNKFIFREIVGNKIDNPELLQK